MQERQLLETWREEFKQHLNSINIFTSSNTQTAFFYEKSKKEIFDIGFNVFKLSSDLYYRENFHSDIIKAFLDPSEKHNEKTKYLNIFIDLLNKSGHHQLNKYDFENAMVIRERNNIDILIADEISTKAIIIENKINNAIDQKRQLPRYFNTIKEKYNVEAIVYLTLNSTKRPEKNDWTKDEILQIEPILKVIPSLDKSYPNLFHDWIVPSIIESKNSEGLFLLQQYGNLIKHINSQTMDTISVEKFYNTLKENDSLKTSISIRNMLNDLPEYMAIRIEDKYKNHYFPFSKIWRYQLRDCVFECFDMEGFTVKMDIWCGEYGYKIHVWNPKNTELDIKQNLPELACISDFTYDGGKVNNVFKEFSFFEEELVFEFIDQIIAQLKTVKLE
ncbi:PD-(D/E)XK nuclease family protein [Flavobacterium sp. 102]|uniref:PDDEXK-like family protein n=1 Tax=Flavobacterium sp. 102 TaxID=2135623 RepID=UPI000EB5CBEF|nr:PD-(D/E)XK nuclease family protein [Flavobacterium sp. 102]RKS03063.1 PD-(D/E)XK nuclease superfamily protein [Flavobacterium sp. 102]